jgi:hypothetical protein
MAVSDNAALAEQFPSVAVTSKGKAVVVFERGSQIWSNLYDPATDAWGTPVKIDDRPQTASIPHIAVDKNDNLLVVWTQDPNAALKGVWFSTSADGVTWSAPASITTTAVNSSALAMNADGVAVVAWTEAVSSNMSAQIGASFRPGPGMAWTTPVTKAAGFGESDDRAEAVAVSGKGEAFVVWEQTDMGAADQESIFEMHHTAAGWSAPKLFETFDGGPCYDPNVATNTAGTAVVTWIEVDSDMERIRARRRAFGDVDFGMPQVFGMGGIIENLQAPALVLDEAGKATLAWANSIQSKFNVFAARSDLLGTVPPDLFNLEFDNPNTAADDDPNDAYWRAPLPALAVDHAGNVTLVWRKRVDKPVKRFDLWSMRFPAGGMNWTTAAKIETRDIGSVEWPAVAANADGMVVAAWNYTVETDVWAAVFR